MLSDVARPAATRSAAPLRRALAALAAACLLLPTGAASASAPAPAASAPKVLRYAFRVAETSFDGVVLSDIYSRIITAHIFEGLYGYDPLARPALVRPVVAAGMPEIANDFRVFVIHVQPGIFFADDP